jgi:RNA polymerase sigma-70 factor (ECF subfamily)
VLGASASPLAHAFGDFYDAMAPSILRYFMRKTREPHRSFDLTAETFAKAFEKRHDFAGATEQQAAAWLWTIARNELARYRRSQSVEFAALSRLGLERPAPSDEELRQVEEIAAVEEAQGHVGRALSLLPQEQRRVIEMRFIEHLSYEEIAARIGVSNDVVRARASRALRTLRADEDVIRAVHALES